MLSAIKPSLRKPVAATKPNVARRSLHRVVAAAPPIPDADGHEALGRAMSGLVKGGLVAFVLVTASVSAYLHVMHNQHKSFEQLVQDLISPPPPMFVSRVKGCVAPAVATHGPDLEFSAALPKALLQAARSSEAATQFIGCIATTAPRRLCVADARATLAADLKVHAHVRESLAARIDATRHIKPSESIDQSLVEPIRRETAKALDAATHAVAEADGMVGQVARLARAGHLAPSDFGVFGLGVPAFYADALAGAGTARADCAGSTPG